MLRIPGRKPNETRNRETRNVKTLLEPGKLANLQLKMNWLKIDILGESESHCLGAEIIKNKYTTYYSGTSKYIDISGVAIIQLSNNVQSFVPISYRVILVKLKTLPRTINKIQTYAPTANLPVNEAGEFHEQRKEILEHTKNPKLTFV